MLKTLKNFNVAGKRILLRCDFNVPLDDKGDITDDYRIQQSLPTIKYLIEKQAKVVVMAHLDPDSTGVADKKYNLDNIRLRLEKLLGVSVKKSSDCIGREAEDDVEELKEGGILLLENLRFHEGETKADPDFAENLSKLGDIFINDAFSVCHRNHASVALMPKYLPAGAGILLAKEIESLDKVLKNPEKPMVAIVGGKKVETKSKFINNISKSADCVIISGLIENEVQQKGIEFDFPDKIVFPQGDLVALDINEDTIKLFKEKILPARTVLWNGPFGKFEDEQYSKGTLAIADAIIESKAFSVIGGGETVEFISKHGLMDKFSHVSTGGGAMMAYLSGEDLPGVSNLI